jgi:hypothetical protein
MRYYPREASPFWVEVVISKSDGRIETREYRGEELAYQAFGPDFRKAMIHATITGLEEVSQRTKKPKAQMGQTAQFPYSEEDLTPSCLSSIRSAPAPG